MTESVARVKILAQIEGLEGFDKLKGAFKGLQTAIGPADQQLSKARQDIIAFGEAGKRTEQIIRGQIDALRALKSQAGTGGQLYTTLGADIRRLEGEVRGLSAAYVDLANNKSYTEAQLRNLSPATSKPGMLSAQVELMQADLARMTLLTREYIAQIAEINKATTEGRRKQTTTDLFGAALSGNQYLNNTNFFDAPAAFEKQANAGVLPRTVAAKQAEISQIKEQLQNVLRDAGNLEPLLNDIRRIETRLTTQSTSTGGTRTTIGGLESVGRDLGTDWQKARITLGQLTTEYERLKRAQQDQVRVLETQLLEAEEDLQRMLNGTTKESEQLTRAEERRARVAEKLAQIQQDASRAPGVGGYRDPETGAMLARGNESTRQARQNLLAQIQMPVREISSLYQSIGSVGISKIANDVERMGNSYQEVAKDIRAAKAASDGSVSSLQSQRAAWEALRNSVNANGREFREATRELAALDKQLERTQSGGLRGKIGYIGQGIGAAASAGIFGGPEGALGGIGGGAIGAILGGAPGFAAGSFIGSSLGAYAGMGRQALGGFSTYAADIQKLEIALKGVTKTQDEYQRALAASASVTRDFNVPQLEATRGMTQLSAAVIGAGGKVADAEVVFRNVTAAIKASGGTSEDVQGALTALGQIFSKGKVSAEELQGQLGERLPGAVTMFAKATGRTLPQLQKDLEQGVVGLADLMKFVTSDQGLGQFEQRAKAVADSSADAGARLVTTWNDTKRAIGEAILPLGAQIQDSLAQALRDATPALVGFAQGLSAAIKVLVDNGPLIAGVLKTLLGFGAVVGVAAGVVQLAGAFTAATAAIASMGGAMSVASLAARTLGVSIAAIPGIGWIAAGATALGLLTVELYNSNRAFKSWVDNIGTIVATDFANAMRDLGDRAKSAFDYLAKLLPDFEKEADKSASGMSGSFEDAFRSISNNASSYFRTIQDTLANWWNQLPAPLRNILSGQFSGTGAGLVSRIVNYGVGATRRATALSPIDTGRYIAPESQRQFKSDRETSSALTEWEKLQQKIEDDKKKAADKAKADAERFAADQQRFNEATARAQIEQARTVFNNQIELIRKRWDYEEERTRQQADLWAGTFEGVRGESARAAVELATKLDAIRRRLREATLGVVTAERNAAFSAQMEAVTGQGLGSVGAGLSAGRQRGQIIEYLTGDRSHSGYRADHGGANYHEHVAFKTAEQMRLAMEALQAAGIKIGSTTGGRHAAGSYHYSGQAFDVPASQVPVGQEQALSRRVREALAAAGFFGSGVGSGAPAGVPAQVRRNVAAGGRAGSANAEVTQATALLELDRARAADEEKNAIASYVQDRTKALREEAKAMENSNELALKRIALEQSGMRPELVDAQLKIAQIEQTRAAVTAQIAANTEKFPQNAEANRLELEEVNAQYDRQIAAVNALAQAQTASGVALANYVGQLKQQLDQLTNLENVLISVGQIVETEISTAMSSAITAVVTGSGSIKQALSQMFASIGQAFVKMATDIIAKQLVIIALNSIAKIFGGGGFGFSGAGPVSGASVFGGGQAGFNPAAFTGGFSFANGGVMTSRGAVPLKKYARGGVASKPQMALFGEGSKPEAYVPLPDGRRIPVNLQANDNNQGGKLRDLMGSSPAAAAPTPVLNMSFQTTNIGGTEYVSRDQLEAAMAATRRQAARDGAKRGMSMTLDKLQQSPGTRGRVGLR